MKIGLTKEAVAKSCVFLFFYITYLLSPLWIRYLNYILRPKITTLGITEGIPNRANTTLENVIGLMSRKRCSVDEIKYK